MASWSDLTDILPCQCMPARPLLWVGFSSLWPVSNWRGEYLHGNDCSSLPSRNDPGKRIFSRAPSLSLPLVFLSSLHGDIELPGSDFRPVRVPTPSRQAYVTWSHCLPHNAYSPLSDLQLHRLDSNHSRNTRESHSLPCS